MTKLARKSKFAAAFDLSIRQSNYFLEQMAAHKISVAWWDDRGKWIANCQYPILGYLEAHSTESPSEAIGLLLLKIRRDVVE